MIIKDLLDYFIDEVFPNITKEESDLIAEIIRWPDEKKAAFMLAKRIFEEEDENR